MRKPGLNLLICLLVSFIPASFAFADTVRPTEPKNVILFIGDGMGFQQVKAASLYKSGAFNSLSFQSLPYEAEMSTHAADRAITDSAASGTAIATGRKANCGVISCAIPGDGRPLQTLLEYFQSRGKATGLVTTTYITHATPAVFAAHQSSRNNYEQIADDYLNLTKPNLLFGAGAHGLANSEATAAGYTVVTDADSLLRLDTESADFVAGLFGTDIPYEYDGLADLPHLSQMTAVALDILDNDPDGFFLMVEGGKIDWACHANDLPRAVCETVEFDRTVARTLQWAENHPETLIIVTADHETGGLKVTAGRGKGRFPDVTWSTGGHTSANVPIYATGPNAHLVTGLLDNTDIFRIATADPTCAASPDSSAAASLLLISTIVLCIVLIGGWHNFVPAQPSD